MRVFGLTGGIGSGKSAVARMFEAEGIPVVDLDRVARDVTKPGEDAYDEIVRSFGSGVLRPDGTVDRKALGTLVFSDPARLAHLESITHPRILARIDADLRALASAGFPSAIVEAALIFEKGRAGRFEAVFAVWCDPTEQVRRLRERDGLSPEEIRRRMDAQMDVDAKAAAADCRIDNSGPLDATRGRVRSLIARFRMKDSPPPPDPPG